MGGIGKVLAGLVAIALILSTSFSVEGCKVTFYASLSKKHLTVDKVGEEYRRGDIYVYIPIDVGEKLLTKKVSSMLEKSVSVSYVGENTYAFSIKVKNITPYQIKDVILEQDITTSGFEEESLKAVKIRSYSPYVTESLRVFPTDITAEKVVVGLPALSPGEEVRIDYNVVGEPKIPKIYTSSLREITREKRKVVNVLVGKYSVFFGYGKSKAKDINIENIKEVLRGLNSLGFEPVVKIVGMADGKAKSVESNLRVAKSRADFITKELFGENLACLINRGLAENSNPH